MQLKIIMNNICWVFKIVKNDIRIDFYRNAIGRCSSHAERFSILLLIISLNLNRMNNICAFHSIRFKMRCMLRMILFYFVVSFLFRRINKITKQNRK